MVWRETAGGFGGFWVPPESEVLSGVVGSTEVLVLLGGRAEWSLSAIVVEREGGFVAALAMGRRVKYKPRQGYYRVCLVSWFSNIFMRTNWSMFILSCTQHHVYAYIQNIFLLPQVSNAPVPLITSLIRHM